MKNLPDKIYLNFGEITKEEFEEDDYNEFCKLDEFAVTFCEDKVYNTDVEYIRKDAFIEKACEWLSNISIEDMQFNYDDFDTSEGWYEFVKDFRKYMKGE